MCNGAPFTVEKMHNKDSVCSNGNKFFSFKAGGAEMGITWLPPLMVYLFIFYEQSVVFNGVLNHVTEV